MRQNCKKWIWVVVLAAVLCAGIGLWLFASAGHQKPVYVFSFEDGIAGMPDYSESASESGGVVTTDHVQPVHLTDTQKVLEVCVSEGQHVKKGDVLFTYDTTLSEINLTQKDLAIQQAKLDLETFKRELAVINTYVPISYHPVEPTEPSEQGEPVPNLAEFPLEGKEFFVYSGTGDTTLTPKYCWLRSSTMVDETLMAELFSDTEENLLFVRFQYTQDDANDGAVTEEYGIKLMRLVLPQEDGAVCNTYRYSFFNPNLPETQEPADDGIDINSGYTASEIAAMRTEKQSQIREKEFAIKVLEAEYSIMQKEADSGQVTAQFDGVVMNLQDEQTARDEKIPFMKVSGGGGFYVMGTISELELGRVQVGQKVHVNSWDTMELYEGSVVEIQDFPQASENSIFGDRQNVSYYPCKIFIDGSADLQDGSYVSLQLQAQEGETSLYVDNAFVLAEGASNYVYVRDLNGKLEKRKIQVGKSLWGSHTQVLSGITQEDWLAFPYGNSIKEGVPTQEGTFENLSGN